MRKSHWGEYLIWLVICHLIHSNWLIFEGALYSKIALSKSVFVTFILDFVVKPSPFSGFFVNSPVPRFLMFFGLCPSLLNGCLKIKLTQSYWFAQAWTCIWLSLTLGQAIEASAQHIYTRLTPKYIQEQARLGVPHSETQVKLDW